MTDEPNILAELARCRAIFQLRAIVAFIHGEPCPPRNPRNNPLYQSHDFLGAGNGNLFHDGGTSRGGIQ